MATGVLGFDIGVATLTTHDGDDFPGIQIDAYGEGLSGTVDYEHHSPYGLMSRPLDPDTDAAGNPSPAGACTVLFAKEGGRGHAWALNDPRVIPKIPKLQKGETVIYAGIGQFVRLDKDGAISLFTTDDGTTDGKSVYLQVARDALRFFSPWGTIVFDKTGFHLRTYSGGRIDLGGIGGVPLVSSYATIQAQCVNIEGGMVAIGAQGATTPLALAQPVIDAITALATAVAAGVTVSGGSFNPASAAAIKTAAAAITACLASSSST